MRSTADNAARPDRGGIRARGASPLVAAAIAVVVLAAGCGTSSPSRPAAARTTAELAFSKCMRAHGVPNFPDPGASISGPFNAIAGIAIPTTIDIQSPAFVGAQNACHRLLAAVVSPPGGKPPITASLKASLIAHAQCMRTHGVPTYPDPTFPPGGGIAITDAGTNPQSPAYVHAQAVCAKH